MTALAHNHARLRRAAVRHLLTRGLPSTLVWTVVASRLLVIGTGVAGSLLGGRAQGWGPADPTRITSSLGTLGDMLIAASVRWDSIHYLSIAKLGYKPANDTGFFPFYPLTIRALGWVVGSDVAAGLLISVAALAVALVLVHRLACEEVGRRAADATVLLLAFAPLSLFFTAIYTESLMMALSVGTLYLAKRGHFAWACATAACAALTHGEGIVLLGPLTFIYWDQRGRPRDLRRLMASRGVPLALPLIAVAGFAFYLHAVGFGWLAGVTGSGVAGHGHSIAPLAPRPGSSPYHREFLGPVVTIWRALVAGLDGLWKTLGGYPGLGAGVGAPFTIGFQNLVYLVVLLITLAALVGSWRRLSAPYAIYATLVVLLFVSSVVTVIPLLAFDRYMLPVFPLWMSAAAWLEERRLLRVVLPISTALLLFYTFEFSHWVAIA